MCVCLCVCECVAKPMFTLCLIDSVALGEVNRNERKLWQIRINGIIRVQG